MENAQISKQVNEAMSKVLLEKFSDALDAVLVNRRNFLEQPAEPETIHQLRVAMRTYKSLVSLTKAFLPVEAYQTIRSLQRTEAQKTARLREIDVLIALVEALPKEGLPLQELTQTAKQSDEGRTLLLEAFGRRRAEHQDRCLAFVRADEFEKGIQDAHALLLDRLEHEKLDRISVSDVIYPRLEQWYGTMLQRMEDYHEFSFAYIHRTRILAKKTRYISELFEAYLSPLHVRQMINAKALQTKLGEICDCINHQALILEILFPPEEAGVELSFAGYKKQAKLRRAANILILLEKAAELGHREAVKQLNS